MKLLCTQENLKNGISIVEKIINKNINLPILDNILLETDEGKLKISSTNLEIGINCWIRSKIEEKGSITIPARIISNFVGSLSSGATIKIEEKNGILHIEADNYKANIKGMDAKEYPLIPQVENKNVIEINGKILKDSLVKVVSASSINSSRPELSGVFMQASAKENYIKFAATDSFRLGEVSLEPKTAIKEDFSLIIPAKTVHEIIRIIGDFEDNVKIFNTESQILFDLGNINLVSRLINGSYPNYSQIIPNEYISELLVEKEVLVKAVKIASFFTGSNNDVKMEILKDKIKVSACSSELGDNVTELAVENTGKEVEIIFNYKYFLDGVQNTDSDKIRMLVSGKYTPTVIKNDKKESYLYLVMPIRS